MPTAIPVAAEIASTEAASKAAIGRTVTTHARRTMMLAELSLLLEATPSEATPHDYRVAALEANALLKGTATSRKSSYEHLRGLYLLDPAQPLFAAFRYLWYAEPVGRPLLALLVVLARDRILRVTAPAILAAAVGETIQPQQLSQVIHEHFPLGARTLKSAGRNAASSWAQSGHLEGVRDKRRVKVTATPGATALAMYLGYLHDQRGLRLFETLWAQALDAPSHELDTLALAASRQGWLEYKRIADVAEFGFGLLGRLTDVPR